MDHSLDVLKAAAKKCYYFILPKIRKKFLEKEIFAKLDSLCIWNKKTPQDISGGKANNVEIQEPHRPARLE